MKNNKVLALLACGAIVLSACGQSTNDTTSEETSVSVEASAESSNESEEITDDVEAQDTETQNAETADASESDSSEGSSKDSETSDTSKDSKTSGSKKEKSGDSDKTSEDSSSEGTLAYSLSDGEEITEGTYTAENEDESAIGANGSVTATITNATIEKLSGDATSADSSSFEGVNAAVRVYDSATVTIKDSTVTATADNATGVFAYDGGTIYISDSTVDVTGGGAGGIQVAGGGTLYAENLTVTSASKAAIRSDRGGGTLVVNKGTYTSTGTGGCPAIYSTADITVTDAECISENSRAVIIEGKNSVVLENCTLSGNDQSTKEGSIKANVLLYQSASGDAEDGTSVFTMNGGSMVSNSGAMFYCTNTSSVINLSDADLELSDTGEFLIVSAGRWGSDGSNGGTVELNADNQTIEGTITVDEISSLTLNLTGSEFEGSINTDGEAGSVSVTLDDDSKWVLTGDSYITEFDGDTDNIETNGYHVYVNGEELV
ncbi:MAG: right-handed parallel beta-helix repeat-containing protein [Butyrivibrio sp.]|uniref:right-handed parallel beta-helix repeat-containing protein n=1 Tax=Butyrivibrio sp. TaxID=28121 RepID=UPI0025D3154A|nr:hypothetical protein [Butyrivibrio sp.]MCR5769906.1 right-handed parallel beta-helix repeat-containing protein [Butyrivibrio sp.]